MIQYLKEIFYLLGKKKRKVPWMIVLFLASSLLDLMGLGLIAPYMLLIVNPASSEAGFFASFLSSFVEMMNYTFTTYEFITFLSFVLLGVFSLKAVCAIYIQKKIIKYVWEIRQQLQSLLMKSYQNLVYSEYFQRNTAEYVYAIHGLTEEVANSVVRNLLQNIGAGITLIALLGMLALNNGIVLGLLFLLIGGASFAYDRFYRNKSKEYGRLANLHAKQMFQGVQEGMAGLKEIRILGRESYFHKIVQDNIKPFAFYNVKKIVMITAPRYLLEVMLVIFVVSLVLGTLWVGRDVQAIAPTLALFGFASMRLIPSAIIFINGMTGMRIGRAATSMVYKDIQRFMDKPDLVLNETRLSVSPELFVELALNDVNFRYPGAEANALNGVTLKIRKGEAIGLIGSSGSGKTTLVDTMLGLLEPQSGTVEFNHRILSEALTEWRSNVAYLPQEVFLIDHSLRCNIALGVEEKDIDEERLNNAIQSARLADLVAQLPKGVETILGERGTRLSGGQRQRVAIARAFYHGRNVLIMDESTSALDNETEKEIVEEIKRLKGKITLIVIAHRLSTVQHCDRVYRLEKGQVVDSGSYEAVVGVA